MKEVYSIPFFFSVLLKEMEDLQECYSCLLQKLDAGLPVKTWHLLHAALLLFLLFAENSRNAFRKWQVSLLLLPLQNPLTSESVFFQHLEKEVILSLKAKRSRSAGILVSPHYVLIILRMLASRVSRKLTNIWKIKDTA